MFQKIKTWTRRLFGRFFKKKTDIGGDFVLMEVRTLTYVHGAKNGFLLRPTKVGCAVFKYSAAISLQKEMGKKGFDLQMIQLADFIKSPGYANRSQRRKLNGKKA